MGSFLLSKRIARAPGDVFAALADAANQRALFAGTTRSDAVPPGALRAGSVLQRTRTVAGTTVSGDVTVDVFRPGKELSLRGETKGIRIEQRWRLSSAAATAPATAPATPDAAAAETKVEYECRIEASGLAALFAGAVLDAVRTADADHLDRLAALLAK